MLRFDRGFELRTPISNFIATRFQYEIPMLFPYWSVIERWKSFCFGEGGCLFNHVNRSSVLYQMYTASSQTPSAAYVLGNASEQVNQYQMKESGDFSGFVAKKVLVVTWLRLRPLEETPSEGIVSIALFINRFFNLNLATLASATVIALACHTDDRGSISSRSANIGVVFC